MLGALFVVDSLWKIVKSDVSTMA